MSDHIPDDDHEVLTLCEEFLDQDVPPAIARAIRDVQRAITLLRERRDRLELALGRHATSLDGKR